MVEMVTAREDEFVYATVSFLKQRFQTEAYPAGTDIVFGEEDGCMMFEFGQNEGERIGNSMDPAMLLKLNQHIHVTILKQRKNEKAIVLGTKNLDWRAVLHSNAIEINAEVLPVDLTKQGTLCLV